MNSFGQFWSPDFNFCQGRLGFMVRPSFSNISYLNSSLSRFSASCLLIPSTCMSLRLVEMSTVVHAGSQKDRTVWHGCPSLHYSPLLSISNFNYCRGAGDGEARLSLLLSVLVSVNESDAACVIIRYYSSAICYFSLILLFLVNVWGLVGSSSFSYSSN